MRPSMGGNFAWEETSHFLTTPLDISYILDVFQDFSKPSWLRVFLQRWKGPQEKRQLVKPLEAPHIGDQLISSKKTWFNGSFQKKTQHTQQHPEKTRIFWPCFAPSLLQRHNQCLWISHHLGCIPVLKNLRISKRITLWKFHVLGVSYIVSGQNIIFHQPKFPWNKGISVTKPPQWNPFISFIFGLL